MEKNIHLIENQAGGIDLGVDRDAGNPVRILTGKPQKSIEFWKELMETAKEAIVEISRKGKVTE